MVSLARLARAMCEAKAVCHHQPLWQCEPADGHSLSAAPSRVALRGRARLPLRGAHLDGRCIEEGEAFEISFKEVQLFAYTHPHRHSTTLTKDAPRADRAGSTISLCI